VARIAVHVTPKSGRDEVVGWRGTELAVRVTAPPEGGKATAAVCKVIASSLRIAKTKVQVVRGDTARHKVLDIEGINDAELAKAFGEPDASLF